MRVAALYDIHGNLPALEAVLEDVRRAGVDLIVVGGDVCPARCALNRSRACARWICRRDSSAAMATAKLWRWRRARRSSGSRRVYLPGDALGGTANWTRRHCR